METLRVRVEKGKLVGEAPPSLPEGTELELCIAEPEDAMSEQELAALQSTLDAAWESVRAGRLHPAAEVIAELRARH